MKHLAASLVTLCLTACEASPPTQQPSSAPEKVGYITEPLGKASTPGITQIPLEVDMALAEQFVRIGFGPLILGQRGFQSTEFLTPRLSTVQAAQLVLIVPEYGSFKGSAVSEGIKQFAGRVSAVEFGREGSPVLYFDLPYWTHQREGPLTREKGTRISDAQNKQLVEELRRVFVGELGAEEFGPDRIDPRRIRIWWHH
jgi:hypothetical protein